jgi:hypothetical protein
MFLTKGNVETIWEVLQDEKLPNMNRHVFINNIKLFGEKERTTGLTLYQMNTKFIMQFKDFMVKEYQLQQRSLKQQQTHQQQSQKQNNGQNINNNKQSDGPIRLNIQENDTNYSITAEELHAERIGEFEKQLSQKQNEFSSLMTQEKPEELNFSDVKDTPIGSEMEQLIARTLLQRNFDIEQIHSQNTSTNATTSWLSSKETSLKAEKKVEKSNNEDKHISWSNELTSEEPRTESIFSKLKQVKNLKENNEVKEVNDLKDVNDLKEINDKLDKIIKHFNIL